MLLKEDKHPQESAILTNICIVEDINGNVLALDKVTGSYRGTTFPGGHVEKSEILKNSIIREIKEETGLDIKNPRLKGIYHWYRGDIHNILFVYHTKEFSGEVISSREGRVYWIPLKELKTKELALGTLEIISMVEDNNFDECLMKLEDNTYTCELY